MRSFKKLAFILFFLSCLAFLTGCNEDVPIFRKEIPKGVQIPVKADELEMGCYYVKEGTQFIKTLPLKGSGANTLPQSALAIENKDRLLYAGPYEDTLIPTHYKGEVIAMANEKSAWENVTLERYYDLRYSVGFGNATYDREENSLNFKLSEFGIKGTDFYTQADTYESDDIRVVGLDGEALNITNFDADCGILKGMEKDETHIVALYAGTYYHEMEVKSDTQMFQSYEVYAYGSDRISDTPNGYKEFATPENLKSGYYAIDGKGLFRYMNFVKGEGDVENTPMNEAFYKSDLERLAQFSKQYSFYVEQRVKNMTVQAVYDENSVLDEEDIKGYAFAPDGTEYDFVLNTEDNTLKLELSEAVPGRWVVNVVPMEIKISSFTAVDNTPDQALTQEQYNIKLKDDKENIVVKVYFTPSTKLNNVNEADVNGTMISPDGSTYVFEKGEEKDLAGNVHYFLQYHLAYAPAGDYEVNINHYPERTTVSDPQVVNNTETHIETIVIDG